MTGALSPTHWLIIIVVVVVLFGAKRLPDAARGLGQALRVFKAETSALDTDRSNPATTGPTGTAPSAADGGDHPGQGVTTTKPSSSQPSPLTNPPPTTPESD